MKTATKERPIIFSAPMVLALLEGRKTQTRRTKGLDAINTRPGDYRLRGVEDGLWYFANNLHSDGDTSAKCPYGQPGDRLWVRETHQWRYGMKGLEAGGTVHDPVEVYYRATPNVVSLHDHRTKARVQFADADAVWRDMLIEDDGWRPSIFMPRWASRITLEITDVRVERVQDISEEDAIAEGTGPDMVCSPEYAARHGFEGTEHDFIFRYRCVWDSINGKTHPWARNPFVWALTFKRVAAIEAGRSE